MAGTHDDVDTFHLEDAEGIDTEHQIAWAFPATRESIITVLNAPVHDNGRSEFQWLVLQDNTVMLGVFPCGDTYFATEGDHQVPWNVYEAQPEETGE